MKKLIFPALLLTVLFACNNTETKEPINPNLTWAQDVKSVLPMEKDTVWEGSDFTNAENKFDREKIISSVKAAILAGKLKAYKNYPDEELTVDAVKNIFVKWDSTAQAEDPNNPGTFVSAPIKMEVTADMVPKIEFHETIELDTMKYSINKKVSYITLFTYKYTEKGEMLGLKRLFDVKMNE